MVAAAFPKWVMLERIVFRRGPKSFIGDPGTYATGITCAGTRSEVSFVLAEPPTPSRMYLSWPEGPSHWMACYLAAAHRDLVLLRLDAPGPSVDVDDHWYEYFIYIAGHPTLLRPLPCCVDYEEDDDGSKVWFNPIEVGLLSDGEDKFAVACLSSVLSIPQVLEFRAELWVICSSRSSCYRGEANAERWEKKLLPIPCQKDDHAALVSWVTDEVVPFNNSLCWVGYRSGILVCNGILEGSPRVSFIRFPNRSTDSDPCISRYRGLCVTDGGSQLALVDIADRLSESMGAIEPASLGDGITLTVRTLDMATENRTARWQQNVEAVKITSEQLLMANPACPIPYYCTMIFPLLSMDVPGIVHVVLLDWRVVSLSLVSVDLSNGKVLGPVVPYLKSYKEGEADDPNFCNTKHSFFTHFLPSEFPKFLNLSRSFEGEPPTSHDRCSRKRKAQMYC